MEGTLPVVVQEVSLVGAHQSVPAFADVAPSPHRIREFTRSTRRALERQLSYESSSGRRPISLLAFRERRSDTDPVRAGQRPCGPWSSRPVSPPSHDALLVERLQERSSRSAVGLFGQRPPEVGHTPVAPLVEMPR